MLQPQPPCTVHLVLAGTPVRSCVAAACGCRCDRSTRPPCTVHLVLAGIPVRSHSFRNPCQESQVVLLQPAAVGVTALLNHPALCILCLQEAPSGAVLLQPVAVGVTALLR
jgi:hypothetical protein